MATPFDKLLVFADIWGPDFDTLQKADILTRMVLSPIITETYAFYELFYGDLGVVRSNDTQALPAD